MPPESGFYCKNDNDVKICWHDIIFDFFWRPFVSLINFSYWLNFHVNIITGFGVMTIFFFNGLTIYPEIGINTIWVLPNNWRLGQIKNTKFGINFLMKCYWMLQNVRGYNFYRFWVTKVKPTGRAKERGAGLGKYPPLIQIKVNSLFSTWYLIKKS